MDITKEYIEQNYKDKIDKYYAEWKRDVVLEIVPHDLTDKDIQSILDLMINKGYTFLVAYYKYKDPSIKIIYIDNISICGGAANSEPREKKIQAKIEGIKLGVLNTVVLNKSKRLIDGYTIYKVFKNNNEIYLPYKTVERRLSYGNSGSISRTEFRKMLYDENNGKCYICGRPMDLDRKQGNYLNFATVDHLVPLAKGGSNDKDNCIICCGLCNQLKNDKLLTNKLKSNIKTIVDNSENMNLIKMKKALNRLNNGGRLRDENTN